MFCIFENNGLFSLNLKYFRSAKHGIVSYGEDHIPKVAPLYSDYMFEKFGQPRKKSEELTQYHKDLAASVQRITEELIFHLLNHLQKRTGSQKGLYCRWRCAEFGSKWENYTQYNI